MMRPLPVSQAKLLQAAARNTHGVTAFHTGFITSRRSCPSYGARAHAAALKLRAAGLVTWESSASHVYHLCHGWGADHSTEHVIKITETGRAALAAMGVAA